MVKETVNYIMVGGKIESSVMSLHILRIRNDIVFDLTQWHY